MTVPLLLLCLLPAALGQTSSELLDAAAELEEEVMPIVFVDEEQKKVGEAVLKKATVTHTVFRTVQPTGFWLWGL